MAEATQPESFEQIVEWAYLTLPQKIRELPDFPGIQVADEPPVDILGRKNWRSGRELLGCYSGIHRTVRQHNHVSIAPDLIFIFRGPIQRCSRGDLRAEVKEVVWHEVAHWLGHSEEEVKELGLSTFTLPVGHGALRHLESERDGPAKTMSQERVADTSGEADETKELQFRCLKCYSEDVTWREINKPLSTVSWLSEPVSVHAKICTCNSCGLAWDDDDNT
jgi:predicted Zn-dependent protease with MMP-like domain